MPTSFTVVINNIRYKGWREVRSKKIYTQTMHVPGHGSQIDPREYRYQEPYEQKRLMEFFAKDIARNIVRRSLELDASSEAKSLT